MKKKQCPLDNYIPQPFGRMVPFVGADGIRAANVGRSVVVSINLTPENYAIAKRE